LKVLIFFQNVLARQQKKQNQVCSLCFDYEST